MRGVDQLRQVLVAGRDDARRCPAPRPAAPACRSRRRPRRRRRAGSGNRARSTIASIGSTCARSSSGIGGAVGLVLGIQLVAERRPGASQTKARSRAWPSSVARSMLTTPNSAPVGSPADWSAAAARGTRGRDTRIRRSGRDGDAAWGTWRTRVRAGAWQARQAFATRAPAVTSCYWARGIIHQCSARLARTSGDTVMRTSNGLLSICMLLGSTFALAAPPAPQSKPPGDLPPPPGHQRSGRLERSRAAAGAGLQRADRGTRRGFRQRSAGAAAQAGHATRTRQVRARRAAPSASPPAKSPSARKATTPSRNTARTAGSG